MLCNIIARSSEEINISNFFFILFGTKDFATAKEFSEFLVFKLPAVWGLV